jgi:hypothetical protein
MSYQVTDFFPIMQQRKSLPTEVAAYVVKLFGYTGTTCYWACVANEVCQLHESTSCIRESQNSTCSL